MIFCVTLCTAETEGFSEIKKGADLPSTSPRLPTERGRVVDTSRLFLYQTCESGKSTKIAQLLNKRCVGYPLRVQYFIGHSETCVQRGLWVVKYDEMPAGKGSSLLEGEPYSAIQSGALNLFRSAAFSFRVFLL